MGTLYYGDNLDILRRYQKDETVDLVYLDPPFNSAQTYNAFFHEKDGTDAASQIKAFGDTWHWDTKTLRAHSDFMLKADERTRKVMQAFYEFLGGNDMMAYLSMMAPRLVELRRVLKPTGSLYLHCDPTASHYLKLLLDAVFGNQSFRNEVVWKRVTSHSDAKRWSPITDTIFYYAKTETFTWNAQYMVHGEDYVADKYRFDDHDGRGPYRLGDMTSPNPRPNMMYEWKGHQSPTKGWRFSTDTMQQLDADRRICYPDSKDKRPQLKRYLREMAGHLVGSLWDDIPPINSMAKERLGYPTQKPLALLERIINASSNPGEVVLDPFCGCGTTIDAAEKLGRQWVGIDITPLSITLIKSRLTEAYPKQIKFLRPTDPEPEPAPAGAVKPIFVRVIGEPVTPADAARLAEDDKWHFQLWALGLVGARPVEQKKGVDHGIDGRALFRDHPQAPKPQQIIIQVKGGKTGVKDVRDLRGVLDREQAAMGVLISLQPPTGPMEAEAASAGFYTHALNGQQYPRLQLRTVKQLMDGQPIERPSAVAAADETFKKAPESKKKHGQQNELRL